MKGDIWTIRKLIRVSVLSIVMIGRAIQRERPAYRVVTRSRVYADINARLGNSWYGLEKFPMELANPTEYEIGEIIGAGKYADVFLGYKRGTDDVVALKILKPVKIDKYIREAKVLFDLKDGPNIVKLLDIIENPLTSQYTLAFEYFDVPEFTSLIGNFNDIDARICLYQLLRALQFSHSHGIMHRDIKPLNLMFDPKTKRFRLIDWGLAEFYQPSKCFNIHVASKHFKAIELLVDYQYYDYSVDMWGFGVTMASIIFSRNPFFRGESDFDMVAKIVAVLGRNDFDSYLQKYGIELPEGMLQILPQNTPRKNLLSLFPRTQKLLASEDAIDLIDRCLRYDHTERITAEEAMNHPYFNPVRDLDLP